MRCRLQRSICRAPCKSYCRWRRISGGVGEVGFDLAIRAMLGVGEADTDRPIRAEGCVAPAETLAPEIVGFGGAMNDGPIFHHGVPGFAIVERIFDLIFR